MHNYYNHGELKTLHVRSPALYLTIKTCARARRDVIYFYVISVSTQKALIYQGQNHYFCRLLYMPTVSMSCRHANFYHNIKIKV